MEHITISFILTTLLLLSDVGVEAINCFTCSSKNGTDENCHDPFNPAFSIYTENCMEPKRDHIGLFPANFCLKVVGTFVKTRERFVIRRCALEHMDNQCGMFKFEEDVLHGCILTCEDDGCNEAPIRHQHGILITFLIPLLVLIGGAVQFNFNT